LQHPDDTGRFGTPPFYLENEKKKMTENISLKRLDV